MYRRVLHRRVLVASFVSSLHTPGGSVFLPNCLTPRTVATQVMSLAGCSLSNVTRLLLPIRNVGSRPGHICWSTPRPLWTYSTLMCECVLWSNCLICVPPQVLQKLGKAVETKDEQFELCSQSLNKQQVQQQRSSCPSVNHYMWMDHFFGLGSAWSCSLLTCSLPYEGHERQTSQTRVWFFSVVEPTSKFRQSELAWKQEGLERSYFSYPCHFNTTHRLLVRAAWTQNCLIIIWMKTTGRVYRTDC